MADDLVLWRDHTGEVRPIRGKSGARRDRYGVVKFAKSLCNECNNERSKPLDEAYDRYASATDSWSTRSAGVNLSELYGADWEGSSLNLARYYAKHFGCRMVRSKAPIPDSLRDFLDGATDMDDAHMALITTDSIRRANGDGLTMSPDGVTTDGQRSRFTSYVFAAYVGPLGVRYEWRADGIPERSQFFHYPVPVVNRFRDETAVFDGQPRRLGFVPTLSQWLGRRR